MDPKLTPEAIATIQGIVQRVEFEPGVRITFPGPTDWADAKFYAKLLKAYRPGSACMACRVHVLNILREAIDIPPVGEEASESLRTRRLNVCRGVAEDGSDACPAYHSTTDSCGRLGLDAINPIPVAMQDGRLVNPCGCVVGMKATQMINDMAVVVFGKAAHKMFRCPADKWPTR